MNRRIRDGRALARRMIGGSVRVLMTAALLGAAVGSAAGQQAPEEGAAAATGALHGLVVNAETGQPVVNAQVAVLGTTRTTLTGRSGAFRLSNLRPGTYRLQVRSVGFRTTAQSVAVQAGDTAQFRIEMGVSAIPLDEVIVTGQPGALARREIGTAVVTINAAEVLATAPVQTLTQLLQARAPGVTVQQMGGLPGQGSRIILRGVGTFTQQVQPLLYVDGVRIDNSAATGLSLGGIAWSGLDDISPEDIERIEIVRGASAAALYGTEAAAGVMQIFTKQGRGGTMNFNFRSEAGLSSTDRAWWSAAPHGDWFFDNLARSGGQHRQYASVRGAADRFSYYASGSFRHDGGFIEGSALDHAAFRANMRVAPSQNVAISLNSGFSERRMDMPYGGNSLFSLGLNTLLGGEEGAGIPSEELRQLENSLAATRYTLGFTIDAAVLPNFTHRLTLGADIFNTDNTSLHPYGTSIEPFDENKEGMKVSHRRAARTLNADYVGRLGYGLSERLRGTTSFGAQGYRSSENYNHAEGRRFVGPGLMTVGASGGTWGDEDRLEQMAAGGFVDQQFGFDDLLFLTLGVRADGHSAFGPEHRYQFYPKAAISYVASDHGYLPELLSTARVRGAFGTAGNQPGNFVYLRTWVPIPAIGSSGLTTGNIGNPDLRPEVSRELELGFDAGVWNDRVSVEFTFYDQRTDHALFPIRYPPSAGFIHPQLENVGTVENRGIELATSARLIQSRQLQWDASASVHTNRNRATGTGSDEPMHVGGSQWIRPGQPVAAFFDDSDQLIGPAFPTRTVQLGSRLGFGRLVSLNLLLDHRGGHYLESNTLTAVQSLDEAPEWQPAAGEFVRPADFWRLREVGLSVDLSERLLRGLPLTDARLSIGGRNLWRQQEYTGFEAEASANAFNMLSNQTVFDIPLPRQIVAGLSVHF